MQPEQLERLKAALADRYRIDRELGRGGMATVYLAHDLRHGREVAIKVLRPELAAALGPQRFLREITVVAKLNHPHILPLHDSGEAAGLLYYVMPYVQGESLRDRLNREKELPLEEALQVAREAADALSFAHAQGVVHRDIKPENILLQAGHAVLTDFGIARAVEAAGGEMLTQTTGLALGTPAYMSPEQWLGEADVDGRSDIYSLACVLYEMLAGEPAFSGPSAHAIMARHSLDPVPRLGTVRPTVPPGAEQAITKALSKAPADRFPTAATFAQALTTRGGPPILPDAKSIAVLPFTNLSADPENEFFSDGLTEEIITDLAQVRALRVISRTSVMRLKGTTKDLKTLGRELSVQYVLEGSVRRAGNNLRVTAQLIDTTSDAHLWAEKYTGTLEDVFEIQERLSRTIVDTLKLELSPDEDRRVAARPIEDVRAYECYLRARQEVFQFTQQALERAEQLIEQGLGIVGDNELLYAALGDVYVRYFYFGIKPDERYLEQAEACVRKIFALNPGSPRGHVLTGSLQQKRGDFQQAVRHQKAALDIEPRNPDALYWLILAYGTTGKAAAARPLAQRLLEIDPLTPLNHSIPGWLDVTEGHFEAALEPYRIAYQMDPEGPFTRWVYALVLAWNRRLEEAYALFGLLAQDTPRTPFAQHGAFLTHALQGHRNAALDAATPQLKAAAGGDEWLSVALADCYALIDEREEGLDWVERAIGRGFINFPFLSQYDPFLNNLRAEERFRSLMRRAKEKWQTFEV